ncbi:hypothetical protein NLG97_g2918 [Lecanicillium saksenae]|uniref:Uncharacterized protein n=1 Tax=Lecanicillium saksenae TaxID=468837 RepID=A0ACC1QZI0_9HYPO|nr:hypothetical protein NLG97_g2918 [Lecanicillium saksenae]
MQLSAANIEISPGASYEGGILTVNQPATIVITRRLGAETMDISTVTAIVFGIISVLFGLISILIALKQLQLSALQFPPWFTPSTRSRAVVLGQENHIPAVTATEERP